MNTELNRKAAESAERKFFLCFLCVLLFKIP